MPKAQKPARRLVRRKDERRPLPVELEALARGDDRAFRRPPRRPTGRVRDPRDGALVPGVANRDARAVYEARVARIRAAERAEGRAALARELAEARLLSLWRAQNVVGWEAFVQDVLGLEVEEANALVTEAALATAAPAAGEGPAGPATPAGTSHKVESLSERTVALWMRTEAGLLEASKDASVHLRVDGEETRFVMTLPTESAATALCGVGRRASPMARPPQGEPSGRAPRKLRRFDPEDQRSG